MQQPAFIATCALGLFGALGCGSRSPEIDRKLIVLDPMAIDDHVVFVDVGAAEARMLDVSGGAAPAAPAHIPLVRNATTAERRKGHDDQLLILCAGQADTSKDVVPEQPGLVVIDSNGKAKTYRYDSPFDRMEQSDDGKFVFLFFGQDTSGGTSFRNPNEVAVINLEAADAKPALKTLRSLGQSPKGVKFSPGPMAVSGADRNLAVVLMDRDVAVIDLSHFDRPEFTVELTKLGASAVSAAQVLFSKETTPRIYLRAEGSDDVFVLSLEAPPAAQSADGGGAQGANDFSLNFSQLGAGGGAQPSDIAFFEDQNKTRLLVAAPGNSTAVVIDADSGKTTTISLPAQATRILLFEGPKPGNDAPAQRALLYAPGTSRVTFLDLAALGTESNRSGNAEVVDVPQEYARLTPLGGDTSVDSVMLLHQSSGLSVLNLGERTLSPITGPNLLGAIPDLDAKKLWLTPPGDRLGFLTLPDEHTSEVRLDAPIEHFVTVPSAHTRKVAVTHPSQAGYMTVLDAAQPADLGKAFAASGYLLEGVLGGANE
jgi:hypothetical protein